MKSLYLVRHAKSSWKYPELSDFDRPLNGRGKRDAPKMGQRLKHRGIFPDLMLSSPAQRALITCETIAKALGYSESNIQTDKAIYHAGSNTLLSVIQEVSNDVQNLMLFGHNPGFTDFANELAGTDIWNIPTCGIFACEFAVNSWKDTGFGKGKKLWYDFPKNS